MDYRIKLLATWGIEFLPYRDEIHYFFQKNITKSLEINKTVIKQYEDMANHHLDNYYKKNQKEPNSALDFGTGWKLAFPLILSKHCRNVVASDIKNLARREINSEVEKILNMSLDRIKYITPCDISKTNFKERSFDLITSNSVLEHIPRKLMPAVARECFRILSDKGICSFHIAHRDHWSHTDQKLEPMNYLKFSELKWRFLNPPLNYQNRMLQSEYISIFKSAGFEWRDAGCSMCLGMNPDQLKEFERCASTSNRNFEGRQGFKGRTHLVSPIMAAAASLEGKFIDVRDI